MEHSWATHYTFVKFGEFSQHYIPKDELETVKIRLYSGLI